MSTTMRIRTIQVGGTDHCCGGGRYSRGWRAPDQDRRPVTRAARVAIQGEGFKEIRDACLQQGVLWEDPDFPANVSSLFYSHRPQQPFEWKRPKELADDPRMMVEGASRFDVKQGDLGNCWFLAAVASLCASCNRKHGNKEIMYRVVPLDNSFVQNYAGVFHFQIWQYGKWIDVIIDDRLPTLHGRLVYMHSADKNEFWSALLEKAYAKLNGSYEALKGGSSSEAMEDFTGGICEVFNMTKDLPKDFNKILLKAHERHSLMACQIDASGCSLESILPNGLVVGHAYSITSVKQVMIHGRPVQLIRLRNPWGNEDEWKGAWSDGSAEWNLLGAQQREELGITFDDDGEFWMSIDDFKRNFQRVEICNLSPDSLTEEQSNKKRWQCSVHEGSWRKRVNAGGCRNFLDTYWTNPQYRVEVVDADEDDDDNKGTLIVGVMQKERRKRRKEGLDHQTIGFSMYKRSRQYHQAQQTMLLPPQTEDEYLFIGFSVYKLPDANCGPLDLNFFKYNAACARSTYSNMREICGRFKLEQGHYAIIPSTFNPNEEADFIVRTYSERETNAAEIDEPTGIDDDGDTLSHTFRFSSHINLGPASSGQWQQQQEQQHQQQDIWHIQQQQLYDEQRRQWQGEQQRHLSRLSQQIQQQMKSDNLIGLEPRRRQLRTKQVTTEDVDQEKTIRELFRRTAGDDLEVDAFELRGILNQHFMKEFRFNGFSLETTRSMVALMDVDKSGKLGYEEFKTLWSGLRQWKKIFKEFDQDKSGTFNSYELRQALNSAAIHVSNSTYNGLVMRFSDQEGRIYFDDFILCAVRLKTMFDIFKESARGAGTAQFELDEFIQTTMYS